MGKIKRLPIAEEGDVVGIEDSTKQVKSLLMVAGGDGWQPRKIVSIVGMGGLVKDLLQTIIKCVTTLSKKDLETLNKEELRKTLHEYLSHGDKRYLIVLDDIWDIEAWDGLNTAFPDKMNGSRILLTTRKRNVACHAGSSSNNIHALRFLNEEESWELFLNKIFASGEETSNTEESKCPLALEEVGKNMVDKCGGLPLAIVVLGGILYAKDETLIAWSRVNVNVNWQLTHGAGSNSCLAILALSYYDLPYYLKPSFLYVGLFPEDHEIVATKLFQCWIAEGFVHSRGEETMEEVAEDYLGELIHRSMIQVGTWRYDGRVRTCRVHDLLRDLTIAESKEDQFCQVIGKVVDVSKCNNVRRLSIHGSQDDDFNVGEQYFPQFHYSRSVRSLMCFGIIYRRKQFLTSLSGCFKLLKVLDVDQCGGTIRLPEEIGALIHLKYLRLKCYEVYEVPNSLFKLVNLQTLNLECGSVGCNIHSRILNLRQLRHLKVYLFSHAPPPGSTMLDEHHLQIGNLTDLQSLCINFSHEGINFGMLDKLKLLKKLEIVGIPGEKLEIFNCITKLTGLQSLKLQSDEEFPGVIQQLSCNSYLTKLNLKGRLFSGFLFPPNLIKLYLQFSELETELIEQVLAKLQDLKFLTLDYKSFKGKKFFLPQGGFLRLQSLALASLELEELIVQEGALISLTHLVIKECRKMEMLPDGMRQLTTLQELQVHGRKKFTARLADNGGEDWDKIKHIPSVIIHNSEY